MGGRGASSTTGGLPKTKPVAPYNTGASSDTSKDLTNMFTELGIKSVKGVDSMTPAIVGAEAIQLRNLEKKYKAINTLNRVDVTFTPQRGAYGSVSHFKYFPNEVTLNLNPSLLGNVSKYVSDQRNSALSGWHTPTDGSTASLARYTVTHEYGHMLHNALYKKAKDNGYTGTLNQYIGKTKREINSIAKKKYGATEKAPSQYGGKNSHEFFAETFANANLGNPNAHGKAMLEWLEKQGF